VTGTGQDDTLVISYLFLRRVVGILGVALPFVLAIGSFVLGSSTGIEASISDYYDTIMRGVFVGILFAIGIFLFSYRGYEKKDNVAGYLACVFAIGVALFPATVDSRAVRTVHFLSAVAMFLTLAYFSYFLFTKSKEDPPYRPEKRHRNRVYRTCGLIIVASIALIALYIMVLEGTAIDAYKPVFVLETLALVAFGFSWFVKGATLWKDKLDNSE